MPASTEHDWAIDCNCESQTRAACQAEALDAGCISGTQAASRLRLPVFDRLHVSDRDAEAKSTSFDSNV